MQKPLATAIILPCLSFPYCIVTVCYTLYAIDISNCLSPGPIEWKQWGGTVRLAFCATPSVQTGPGTIVGYIKICVESPNVCTLGSRLCPSLRGPSPVTSSPGWDSRQRPGLDQRAEEPAAPHSWVCAPQEAPGQPSRQARPRRGEAAERPCKAPRAGGRRSERRATPRIPAA